MRPLPLLLLALTACGGPGSIEGEVAGVKLEVKDAIFVTTRDNQINVDNPTSLLILMGNLENLCEHLKSGNDLKSAGYLSFILTHATSTDAVTPGDFAVFRWSSASNVPPAKYALVDLHQNDTRCKDTLEESEASASSGSVKLSSFTADSGGKASGTFDLTFGGGDTAKGSFEAQFCEGVTRLEATRCE